MINKNHDTLMLKFLNTRYPIVRLKHKNNFKRAIVIDDNTYFINNAPHLISAKLRLIRIIKLVFDCNEETVIYILTKYLPPK